MKLHSTDTQIAQAVTLKLLHARLETGHGEDRGLGADILDAVDAPRTIGNPCSGVDAGLALAGWLGQQPAEVAASVFGRKTAACSADQLARMLCAAVLRVHIANLERPPA